MHRFLIAVCLALGLISAAAPTARALDPDALRQDIIAALNRGISAYRTGPFLFTGVETLTQGAAVRVKIADLALPLPPRRRSSMTQAIKSCSSTTASNT